MGTRAHAVLAWGFEVVHDYSDKLGDLFDNGDIDKRGCCFETYDDTGPSFAYVKKSYKHTDWDDVLTLPNPSTYPYAAWEEKLKDFCKEFEIPWRKPSWFLAAYEF